MEGGRRLVPSKKRPPVQARPSLLLRSPEITAPMAPMAMTAIAICSLDTRNKYIRIPAAKTQPNPVANIAHLTNERGTSRMGMPTGASFGALAIRCRSRQIRRSVRTGRRVESTISVRFAKV